jgi:hypothetical protein
MKKIVISIFCTFVILVSCAQSWYPLGSKPLSQDLEKNSLHKINQLLYSAITNGSLVITNQISVTNLLSATVNVTNSVGLANTNDLAVHITTGDKYIGQVGVTNLQIGLSSTNVIGTTNTLLAATIASTNIINANTGTPVVLGTVAEKFLAVTFIGRKAPRTANTGTVYIQMLSNDQTNAIPILSQGIITVDAPANAYFTAAQFWLDVDTANDGILAFYFN